MSWAPDYAAVSGLRDYLRITDTADDLFLARWITTVSRNVDNFTGRQFGSVDVAEARSYEPEWDRNLRSHVLYVDDLMDVTGIIVVDEDATAITGFTYAPVNNLSFGRPYERLIFPSTSTGFSSSGNLTVTALWGWTAVPAAVETGVFLQSARLAARRDSPFGIAGSPTEGSELRLLAQLDPDFRTSLMPLRRQWWAA